MRWRVNLLGLEKSPSGASTEQVTPVDANSIPRCPQGPSQAPLNEPCPETSPNRGFDMGAAQLLPISSSRGGELSPSRCQRTLISPDGSTAPRTLPRLCRVPKSHRYGESHARGDPNPRTLHVDAISRRLRAALPPAGRFMDVDGRPASVGEHVVDLRQGDEAALKHARCVADRGALRRILKVMDCTVARVFFTRWFSSLIRRSLSLTASRSSSTTRRRSMAAPGDWNSSGGTRCPTV